MRRMNCSLPAVLADFSSAGVSCYLRAGQSPPEQSTYRLDMLRWKFAFPPSDHDCRETIPKNIHCRSGHVHQLIDSEEQEKWLNGQMKLRCCCQHDHKRCSSDSRRPFA